MRSVEPQKSHHHLTNKKLVEIFSIHHSDAFRCDPLKHCCRIDVIDHSWYKLLLAHILPEPKVVCVYAASSFLARSHFSVSTHVLSFHSETKLSIYLRETLYSQRNIRLYTMRWAEWLMEAHYKAISTDWDFFEKISPNTLQRRRFFYQSKNTLPVWLINTGFGDDWVLLRSIDDFHSFNCFCLL